MEKRLSDAERLLSTLSTWRSRWEEDRAAIHTRTLSSPGHAVLAAASITYLARIPAEQHKQLWSCWLGYCTGSVQFGCLEETGLQHSYHSHQPVIQVDTNFSPGSVLSVDAEQAYWSHYASFPDSVTLERCLAARASLNTFSPLPLVLDPYQLFQHYAYELELHQSKISNCTGHYIPASQKPSNCVVILRVSSSGWAESLGEWEEKREKAVVLILDEVPSDNDRETLLMLMKRQSKGLRNNLDQSSSSDQLYRYVHS